MKYKNKAVVLGTNYYIGLCVVRSLGKKGVHVIAVNHNAKKNLYGKSRYVAEDLIGPYYEENPEGFLQFLINIAKDEEYKPVLLATVDPYVEFIERYFDELKEYYLFPAEKKGLLTDLMDKSKLTEYTEKWGVRTPEIVDSKIENLYEIINEEIKYPCIVKPKDSANFVMKYRHKVFLVNNEEELREKVEMCHRDGYEVFIQRIIPGPETNCYSFDAYLNKDSKVTHYMSTYKIRQWPNNFGASTYAGQKWIPEVYDIGKPFLENIGFKGFAEIEWKRDVNTGVIYLIEVNVRFVNFTEMFVRLGMDTPFITYLDMIGEDIGTIAINYDTGVRWRYFYEDIPSMRGYINSGQMTKAQIKEDNRHKKIPSTWALDDPWPGIKFAFSVVFRKIGRILTGK
ncbi:MAG: carboxylate--amine ligase [Tissierellia bacterium]|nr:carboxylate--amine ligase [Tissierellia bacterium]